MSWKYRGQPVGEPPKTAVGFVYLITYKDGRQYIGRKLLTSAHRRQKKKKIIKSRVESNWKDYWSSSPEILKIIETEGTDNFSREILMFASNKSELMYLEEKFQYVLGVIEDDKYFNSNIRSKLFGRVLSKMNREELANVIESLQRNKGNV